MPTFFGGCASACQHLVMNANFQLAKGLSAFDRTLPSAKLAVCWAKALCTIPAADFSSPTCKQIDLLYGLLLQNKDPLARLYISYQYCDQ